MAKNKDRKPLRRRDLRNWLPRKDEGEDRRWEDAEPAYEDTDVEERRPSWAQDLDRDDGDWSRPDEDQEAFARTNEPDGEENERATPSRAYADEEREALEESDAPDEERRTRVRQATANREQADEAWEREAQRVESSQYRRRPLSSDREEDGEAPRPQRKKGAAASKKRGGKTRADEDERRDFIRTVAIVLVCGSLLLMVSLMVVSNFISHPLLALPRKMVSAIVTPAQDFFSGITDGVVDYLRTLKIRGNLEYEYEQLRLQADENASQLAIMEELRYQINALYDLLDERNNHLQMNPLAATVIGHDTANYFSTLTLDVGSSSGVSDYMAVVAQGGLVGVTYNTTEYTCQVRCIIDSDCTVSALVESSRDQGVVKGTLGTNGEPMCRMYYLPDSSLPRPGDVVRTSGVGLEFPKGIAIGYIRESTRGMEDNKSYVVLEPIVDFQHLEYVTVYRYHPYYAEEAQGRVSTSSNLKLETQSTPRPVPTFSAEGVSDFLFSPVTPVPGEEEATPVPSVTATPSPAPTPAPAGTPDPNATPRPTNLAYDMLDVTPTPSPRPTFTPTPSPVPTPDPGAMTVEDEE